MRVTLANPVFVIVLIFSPFAALMAFVATYEESRHHFTDKWIPLKIALEAAAFAFVAFSILGWLAGMALTRLS